MAQDNPFDDGEFAQRYAAKHQKMARSFGEEYTRKLTARGFKEGDILDVGCGFGGTLLYLAGELPGIHGVGIDLSEALLDMARQSAVDQGVAQRVRFEKADAQAIPYPDDHFDVVISTNVVHHVTDPRAMLQEIDRVLAEDGMLYIADIRRSWLAGLFDRAFRETMTVPQILSLLRSSGLDEDWFTTGLLWWRYER